MTRMEKFLEQYPRADVVKYKGEKSLCILPCVVDASLRGDMTRRDCAWSKRYIDCNECCVKFWGEEIGSGNVSEAVKPSCQGCKSKFFCLSLLDTNRTARCLWWQYLVDHADELVGG